MDPAAKTEASYRHAHQGSSATVHQTGGESANERQQYRRAGCLADVEKVFSDGETDASGKTVNCAIHKVGEIAMTGDRKKKGAPAGARDVPRELP